MARLELTQQQFEERREKVLRAAVELAKLSHYRAVTRDDIADQLQIAPTSINTWFGDMTNFRNDLVNYAIDQKELLIIAQALAVRDPITRRVPHTLKTKALQELLK